MKFLRQSTIIGALTVGGFLYSNTIGTLPPASAESQPTQKESRFLDTWRWQNYFLLHHNADFIEELAVGDLKHGDTFDVTIYTGGNNVICSMECNFYDFNRSDIRSNLWYNLF